MNTSNHFEQRAGQYQTRRVRAGQPVQADAMTLRRVDAARMADGECFVSQTAEVQAPEVPSAWRVYLRDLACALLLCAAVMGITALAVAVAAR